MNNCGTKYKLIELLNTIENAFFCKCQKDKLKDLFIDIFNDENLFVVFMNKIDEEKKLLKKDLSFFMDSDPAVNSEDEIHQLKMHKIGSFITLFFISNPHPMNDILNV